jgi:Ca2+-binding EF-hand superfamily protein
MEQEFDMLDVNKDGSLDVGEMTKFLKRSGVGNHR